MKLFLASLFLLSPLSACSDCDSYAWDMQESYEAFADYRQVELDIITHEIRGILRQIGELEPNEKEYRNILLRRLDDEIKMIRYLLEIEQ